MSDEIQQVLDDIEREKIAKKNQSVALQNERVALESEKQRYIVVLEQTEKRNAMLAAHQKQLEELINSLTQERASVVAMQERLQQDRDALATNQADLERQRSLLVVEKQKIAQETVEAAEARHCETVSKLEKLLFDAERRVIDAESDAKSSKKTAAQYENDCIHAKQLIDEMAHNHALRNVEWKNTVANLQNRVDEQEIELFKVQDEKTLLRAEIEKEVRAQVETEMSTRYETELRASKERIAEIENLLKEERESVFKQEKALADAQRRALDCELAAQMFRVEIARMRDEREAVTAKQNYAVSVEIARMRDEREAELATAKQNYAFSMENMLRIKDDEIASLRQSVATFSSLQSSLDSTKKQLDDAKQESDFTSQRLTHALEDNRQLVEKLQVTHQSLHDTCILQKHAKSTLDRILIELHEQYVAVAALQKENDDLKQHVSTADAMRKERAVEIDSLYRQLSIAEQQKDELLKKIVSERDARQQELEVFREASSQFQSRIKVLETKAVDNDNTEKLLKEMLAAVGEAANLAQIAHETPSSDIDNATRHAVATVSGLGKEVVSLTRKIELLEAAVSAAAAAASFSAVSIASSSSSPSSTAAATDAVARVDTIYDVILRDEDGKRKTHVYFASAEVCDRYVKTVRETEKQLRNVWRDALIHIDICEYPVQHSENVDWSLVARKK